jgi:hypothetical protein
VMRVVDRCQRNVCRGNAGRAKSLRRAQKPCDTRNLRKSLRARKNFFNYLLDSRDDLMRTRRLHARLAYVMRVDNRAAYKRRVDYRARVTYAAATSAAREVSIVTPPAPGMERFDLSMAR